MLAIYVSSGDDLRFDRGFRLYLRYAVPMAVGALHSMDVVDAGRACVGCIHLLHVDAAMRHLRVTSLARGPRILIMSIVAGDAAQALVNAHRRAVVAGAHLGAHPLVAAIEPDSGSRGA